MPRFLLVFLVLFSGCATSAGRSQQLPSLPDPEGFAGSFAGVSNGVLLFGGGANFPGRKLQWQGGTKVWYDTVFALDRPDGKWTAAGKLPRPLGYGVSVTYAGDVVCVGGSDARRHYADAFRLSWRGGTIITTPLPPLPHPVANACGALVGDRLYIAGGQERPDSKQALHAVYCIDLAAAPPQWQEVEPWPGDGRMLAVAAGVSGSLFIAGGTGLVSTADGKVQRRYLKDAYRYDRATGWRRIADLPYPVVAAPSPAPADDSGFYILGGDDGSQVDIAPAEHRGFVRRTLRYDIRSGKWSDAGAGPAARGAAPGG
jgi:N-acetylneuraminic acid mutarotase